MSELVFLTVHQLAAAIREREVSAAEVLDAHLSHIARHNPALNAIVTLNEKEARRRAKEADEDLTRGNVWGPLHGVPVTIKDTFETAGLRTTSSFKPLADYVPQQDATVVSRMRAAGAVILGKTNMPELALDCQSNSPIFGPANNPWDVRRTPGGSTGGGAAAVAAGLSPLEIGSDIGGSIRIPCAFTGIAGLKPTVDRWSNTGCVTALAGQETVRGQCGPMARTVRDVAMMFRALDPTLQASRDPAVPPLPYEDPASIDVSKLRIGYYSDDGYLAASSAVRRGVEEAARALEDAGASLVAFHPPSQPEIIDVYFGALSADGGATVDAHLDGEKVEPQLAELRRIAGMRPGLRKAAAVAMGLKGERRVQRLLQVIHEKPLQDYWQLAARRTSLRHGVFAAWARANLDAVICPAHATPALAHGQSGDFTVGGSYSMRYNFLNFAAGVVPVTRVIRTDTPRTGLDRIEKKAALVERGAEGLPIGVQVVARPYREAIVLAVMAAIEAGRVDDPMYPKTPVHPR